MAKQNIVVNRGEFIISFMGLDTVELVMAIEEEFNIEIPNPVASQISILGDMNDYVCKVLRERGERIDENIVWERLQKVVIAQLGVRPEQVTRKADIIRDLRVD